MTRIYKIVGRDEWAAAEASGHFSGAGVDLQDGYIHFSTAAQAAETGRRYFSGREDLVLVEIEGDDLGAVLRWEPSRGGDLFPHLYEPLDLAKVRSVRPVALGLGGAPILDGLAP
jgi:uncharacterized protein (DUF952 family)